MYNADNDIERIFNNDSREKKRVAVGIHKRASRRGYIRGGIKTQYDYLTTKQRKLLNGEVRIWNMYEEYGDLKKCDLDTILTKNDTEIKGILTMIKDKNTCTQICSALAISNGKLYSLYDKYGVSVEKKPRNKEEDTTENIKVMSEKEFKKLSSELKGKYILEFKNTHNMSLSKMAKLLGVAKGSLNYYTKKYENGNGDIVVKDDGIKTQDNIQSSSGLEWFDKNNSNQIVQLASADKLKELNDKNIELESKCKELSDELLKYAQESMNKKNGLRIDINGDYNKDDLSTRLLSLDSITVKDKKYRISLVLEEV